MTKLLKNVAESEFWPKTLIAELNLELSKLSKELNDAERTKFINDIIWLLAHRVESAGFSLNSLFFGPTAYFKVEYDSTLNPGNKEIPSPTTSPNWNLLDKYLGLLKKQINEYYIPKQQSSVIGLGVAGVLAFGVFDGCERESKKLPETRKICSPSIR